MSFVDKFKTKPVVVQRLTFVWCLFSLYSVAYSALWGVVSGSWGAMPVSFIFCALMLALSWGFLQQRKIAWWLGLLISVFWMLTGFLALPRLLHSVMIILSPRRPPSAVPLGRFDNWSVFAAMSTCLLLTAIALMLIAFVLGLSPSGRVAYRIGRPRNHE